MSARDDLTRATGEARAQVRSAREALARSREAAAGGPAKDVAQAEVQLGALREAVATDLRQLRARMSGLDPAARRTATVTTVAGAGALAAVVGVGLAARGQVRRTLGRRDVQRQARALADALARQPAADAAPGRRSRGSRGGRLLAAALTLGAAAAGAVAVQRQRTGPADPDDLWLPERDAGPA